MVIGFGLFRDQHTIKIRGKESLDGLTAKMAENCVFGTAGTLPTCRRFSSAISGMGFGTLRPGYRRNQSHPSPRGTRRSVRSTTLSPEVAGTTAGFPQPASLSAFSLGGGA